MSCCSLGTSTLIFGILGLIGGVGGIIGGVFEFATMKHFYYDYFHIDWSIKMEVVLNALSLGGSLLHLIASILLIVSVKQRMSKLAIPWLVETALAIVTCFCLSIFMFVSSASMALILLSTTVLNVGFWLVVLRFHFELKLEEQNKQSASANENINMENVNVISGIV